MPNEGNYPDEYITAPDGTRIPANMLSPAVAAEYAASRAATPPPPESNLGANIATTAKEFGADYVKYLNPVESGKVAVDAIGAVAEKGGDAYNYLKKETDGRLPFGLNPMPELPTAPQIRALEQKLRGTTPAAPGVPAESGPSNSPNGMILQAAMGAQGPVESGSLKASPGVRVGAGGYGDERKEMDAAAKTQEAATAKLGDVAAERAAAEYGIQQGRQAALEQQEARRVAIETKAQTVAQEQIGKAEKLQGELRKLSQTKIDPNRFWADKDTGDRLAASFGVFLGGLGGGENQALGILNRAIDRDIEAQVQNWNNAVKIKAQEIEGQKNIYGMHVAALGDERAAEAGARSAALEMFSQKLETAKSQYDSPEIKAKTEAAQALIKKELANNHVQLQQAINNDAFKRASLEQQNLEVQMRAQAAQAEARAKAANQQKETYIPGVGLALDPKSKEKVQEAAGAYNAAKGAVQQMQALRKEAGGGEFLDRGLVARMEAAQAEYIGAANQMKKFGALDKGAQELLGTLTGGDITKFGSGVDEVLSQGATALDRTFAGITKPYMSQYEEAAQPVTSARKNGGG